MSVSLAIVDDHQLFREALVALLGREPNLEVMGQASCAVEAYELLEQTHPQVVLMDLAMPGITGISAVRELRRRNIDSNVLMLSMHAEEEYVSQAFAAGASGFALKDQPAHEIVEAIRAVAGGHSYIAPRVSRFVVEDLVRLRRGESPERGPCDKLSVREREIFDLLVRGHSNDSVGKQLCISVKTVETHRSHILKKLNLHSLVDLVRFAARHQLLLD